MSFFELLHTDHGARAGVMHTDHGDIETPCFMPVGTQATVKTLDSNDLNVIDAPIILGNTYHLHLRPGEDIIDGAGGLHQFMNWQRPILTDSGGFQVFSLGAQKEIRGPVAQNDQGRLVKIDEEGVTFTSHIDGSKHRFTPENAITLQHKIGADIIMAFDECTPDTADVDYARAALERTHRWAERCVTEHQKNTAYHGYRQFLFGIIQGAGHRHLREEGAQAISAMEFDGIATGGESIGYNMNATKDILNWVTPFIPTDKPRYTMGVGLDPQDLITAIGSGADMFDCVAPTRLARHGMLFVSPATSAKHRINIRNADYARDLSPIDPTCQCPTCQNYSRAYLHHLFAAGEMTGQRLASLHNLYFMLSLMRKTRAAIQTGDFATLQAEWT